MSLLPVVRDAWSSPFFDAAAQGRLTVLRCEDCGKYSGPQSRRCAHCASERIAWVESTGTGELVTWAIPHRREGQVAVPDYVIAIVQLDEGPWIHAHGSASQALRAGQRLSVGLAAVDGGESLPVLVVDDP